MIYAVERPRGSKALHPPRELRRPHLRVVREAAPMYGEPASFAASPASPAAPASPTSPDPWAEADVLDELADEIATLAAHIHAATRRLLLLIAEFDRRRGWELGGHQSCAHWLRHRTGIDLGTAREKVRVARRLVGLPETSAAMARGELSFSQVRALTRVARPEDERQLLELARGVSTAQLEGMVRSWKRGSRRDEAALERERHERRSFSVFPDEDGMYLVRGRLDPEVAALLMRAVEAASDALFREDPNPFETQDHEKRRRAAAQRRADAIGLLAERALAMGFGRSASGGSDDHEGADADDAPISGTRAARYQVVLHVDAETLSADGEGADEAGRSELEDGTRVSAETSRRLACDAALVRVRRAPNGRILDVGRRTRTISPALRRALDVRDRGCRFPGCGLRFTDAHHVRHWADGGETSLANCALLCHHHHRLLHEGGWMMEWWGEGRPAFIDPRGNTHFDGGWRPPVSDVAEPDLVRELVEANVRDGAPPDGWTAGVRWRSERDIPDDILFAAMEAVL